MASATEKIFRPPLSLRHAEWTSLVRPPRAGAIQLELSSRVQIAGKTRFRNNSVDGCGGETGTERASHLREEPPFFLSKAQFNFSCLCEEMNCVNFSCRSVA